MRCTHCDGQAFAFAVPDPLVQYAPEGASTASLCSRCLRTGPADGATPDPPFDLVVAEFPDGEGGAALALALGMLDSLALNRAAILACCRHAEHAGVDVSLALDRLDASAALAPHFDLERRRRQLDGIR